MLFLKVLAGVGQIHYNEKAKSICTRVVTGAVQNVMLCCKLWITARRLEQM